ncbi:MAG TPA: 1-deoxy-D-xylulose-5-phosphate reductoisomerase [Bacteroidetes bacterium]|nr:1-deoxy-D-xylulose-5-phosphate reductoisomerase [Bacteroidota bacterium]HCN37424.1 1-deoxy-D-xylulose-5-phosphate reductoisomerase [Bacteroidota bacterium]
MKKISIFGSTGSIGVNTLNVIDNLNNNGFNAEIVYLSSNSNFDILTGQINKYKPKGVIINNKESYEKLKSLNFSNTEILFGEDGLLEVASRDDYDILVSALVGFAGLLPTIEAIKKGKRIALANKETLVTGGKIIMDLIKKSGAELLPIDSEHSAILQCIVGENSKEISKLIITASGGPFRKLEKNKFKDVTVDDALNHPNWKMGKKITIDSATLMNKGLEVIEAKWLFDINPENIEVLIHPQSIIHSMVEFTDGSVKSQMGVPDMKIPIQYAITYPERIHSDFERMDYKNLKDLTFEEPDFDKFECLKLAFDSLVSGGTYPVVLNAANEIAVELFLNSKVKFIEIPGIIKNSLDNHKNLTNFEVSDILTIDKITRKQILDKF